MLSTERASSSALTPSFGDCRVDRATFGGNGLIGGGLEALAWSRIFLGLARAAVAAWAAVLRVGESFFSVSLFGLGTLDGFSGSLNSEPGGLSYALWAAVAACGAAAFVALACVESGLGGMLAIARGGECTDEFAGTVGLLGEFGDCLGGLVGGLRRFQRRGGGREGRILRDLIGDGLLGRRPGGGQSFGRGLLGRGGFGDGLLGGSLHCLRLGDELLGGLECRPGLGEGGKLRLEGQVVLADQPVELGDGLIGGCELLLGLGLRCVAATATAACNGASCFASESASACATA